MSDSEPRVVAKLIFSDKTIRFNLMKSLIFWLFWIFKLESFCVGSTTFFQQLWTIKNCQIKKSVGTFMAFILTAPE